jgi:nucleotidyltransferase/DNA polymerase involved in DNA repair
MISAILLRDFAASQEKRLNPALRETMLVLLEAGKSRPKVIASDSLARQMGVKAGIGYREAQSLCPNAHFLPVEEQRYRRLFEDLTLALLDISPRLEMEYQATSAVLYTDDVTMLPFLLEAICKETDIAAQVGKAKTKFVARVAAAIAAPNSPVSVPEGSEAAFLAPYALSLLPLDKTMKRRLPLLGLETLGQYASLPRIAAWEQFGKHGRWLHDLSRGIDPRPLSAYKAPLRLEVCQSFEEGSSDRFLLYKSLESLSLRLIEGLASQAAGYITLLVSLADKTVLEQQRQPHEPLRDTLSLLRHLRQMLDSLPVHAPVVCLEIRLSAIQNRKPIQLSLFAEKKPVQSLQDYLPEWAARHRGANFYHLASRSEPVLEERLEKQKIGGA